MERKFQDLNTFVKDTFSSQDRSIEIIEEKVLKRSEMKNLNISNSIFLVTYYEPENTTQ